MALILRQTQNKQKPVSSLRLYLCFPGPHHWWLEPFSGILEKVILNEIRLVVWNIQLGILMVYYLQFTAHVPSAAFSYFHLNLRLNFIASSSIIHLCHSTNGYEICTICIAAAETPKRSLLSRSLHSSWTARGSPVHARTAVLRLRSRYRGAVASQLLALTLLFREGVLFTQPHFPLM